MSNSMGFLCLLACAASSPTARWISRGLPRMGRVPGLCIWNPKGSTENSSPVGRRRVFDLICSRSAFPPWGLSVPVLAVAAPP
eukprot:CAMPEP_0169476350 /NCGR_PEP_ID=MMETSP1042-20121227/27318_1 /TAXON_ID=464988 /ORGANISM="Hemiselmis andersenii, Strain CCMP1180" /LENGTH=82 /DNA_ID=CAMNT_0009590591 /DNA_START=6 /DNA_END=251 /DNA_ORIENTATION=-